MSQTYQAFPPHTDLTLSQILITCTCNSSLRQSAPLHKPLSLLSHCLVSLGIQTTYLCHSITKFTVPASSPAIPRAPYLFSNDLLFTSPVL